MHISGKIAEYHIRFPVIGQEIDRRTPAIIFKIFHPDFFPGFFVKSDHFAAFCVIGFCDVKYNEIGYIIFPNYGSRQQSSIHTGLVYAVVFLLPNQFPGKGIEFSQLAVSRPGLPVNTAYIRLISRVKENSFIRFFNNYGAVRIIFKVGYPDRFKRIYVNALKHSPVIGQVQVVPVYCRGILITNVLIKYGHVPEFCYFGVYRKLSAFDIKIGIEFNPVKKPVFTRLNQCIGLSVYYA